MTIHRICNFQALEGREQNPETSQRGMKNKQRKMTHGQSRANIKQALICQSQLNVSIINPAS